MYAQHIVFLCKKSRQISVILYIDKRNTYLILLEKSVNIMFNIGRGKPEREYKLEEFEAYIKLCVERDKMPRKAAEFTIQTALNSNNANLLWNFMTMNLFAEHTQNVSDDFSDVVMRKLKGYPEIKSLIYITPSYNVADKYCENLKLDTLTAEEMNFACTYKNFDQITPRMARVVLAILLLGLNESIDGNGNYRKNYPIDFRGTPRCTLKHYYFDELIYCHHGDKEERDRIRKVIICHDSEVLKNIVAYIDDLSEKEMMELFKICFTAYRDKVSQFKLPDIAKVMDKEAITKLNFDCIDEFYEPMYNYLTYPDKEDIEIRKRYTEKGNYNVTTTKKFKFSDWDRKFVE